MYGVRQEEAQLPFFDYGFSTVPGAAVERTILCPFHCLGLLKKNKKTVNMRGSVWFLTRDQTQGRMHAGQWSPPNHTISFMSAVTPIPHSYGYCRITCLNFFYIF